MCIRDRGACENNKRPRTGLKKDVGKTSKVVALKEKTSKVGTILQMVQAVRVAARVQQYRIPYYTYYTNNTYYT